MDPYREPATPPPRAPDRDVEAFRLLIRSERRREALGAVVGVLLVVAWAASVIVSSIHGK